MYIKQEYSNWLTLTNLRTFGATYNCGTYGAGSYDSEGVACTNSSSNGGNLTNTGDDALFAGGVGLVIVVVAAAVLVRMRRKKKS